LTARPLNPYADISGKRAFRGTLHSHSLSADARVSPAEAKRRFLERGFHFVGLTDHDRRWPQLPWTDADWDASEPGRFIVLRGYEATGPGWHVNVVGHFPQPMPQRAGEGSFVEEALAHDAFVFLNHPAADRIAADTVLAHSQLGRVHGLEVYSGPRATPAEGADWRQGFSEGLWDDLLSAGLRVWGLANPDCHTWDEPQPDGPFNGYNVVFAEDLTAPALMSALKRGCFYATTGIEIDHLCVTSDRIEVVCSGASQVRFIGRGGRVLAVAEGDRGVYDVRGDEGYVRVEIIGSTPVFPGFLEPAHKAWTQPITW
jgi:hypothetical protein